MDLGSDGNSAMHALIYKFGANAVQWPDASHGATRDVTLLLSRLSLKNFWVLMCTSWNLPHGRAEHRDGRYWEMQKGMAHYFETENPKTAVLFQAFLPLIFKELTRAGIEFPTDGDQDLEVMRPI